ncbi:hypothetical protein [Spiroplasma alleghenense]|uniref:Colicin V production protein n=1 Tax=Spiroplasma alleghenense TaxID=216931 RepID=A0A345Z3V2_9MOLU|nr:hypothetical protein [Spiroplasma alleghenense]AXK51281.1 hypothetical protein SALLE_v1c06090 [Spiroplasma alleghenense]
MLINIGPWWLFDLLIFILILAFTIWGVKRGTWVMVYFGSVNILVAIVIIFLVPLLTTATVAKIAPLLKLQGLIDAFGDFDRIFQSVFNEIIALFGSEGEGITVNTQQFAVDFINAIVAVILNMIYQLLFFFVINIIALILYFTFIKRKLIAIKINSHANALIGSILGLILGLLASFAIFSTASNPLFKTNNQALTEQSINTDDLSFANVQKIYESGNGYYRRSASSPLFRWIPKFGFYYNADCISKFVVIPVFTAANHFNENGVENTWEITDFINNLYVDNYSTNSYLKTDVRNCSLSMPREAQSLFRIVTESSLMTAALYESYSNAGEEISSFDDKTQFNFSPGSFTVLQEQLQKFMAEENIAKMGIRDFERFYSKNNNGSNNEFIKVADTIETEIKKTPGRSNSIIRVLCNGRLTYNFFKNLYFVNQINEDYGTGGFLPSFYSSLGLIAGLEAVSSGNVINTFTGLDYHTNKKYSFNDWAAIVDFV